MSIQNIQKVFSLTKKSKNIKKNAIPGLSEPKRLTKAEYMEAYRDRVLLRPLKKSIQKKQHKSNKANHRAKKQQVHSLVDYKRMKMGQEKKKNQKKLLAQKEKKLSKLNKNVLSTIKKFL